jgi:hypothetical protein
MLSKIERLLPTVLRKAISLLKYPYLNNGGFSGAVKGPYPAIHHHSGSSALGDWLTQTVSYHH